MIRRNVFFAGMMSLVLGVGLATADTRKKPARKPNPAMAPVKDVPGLPRVLLIGDSISIGYTVPTRKTLEGKANVHRPRTNCGPTSKGVAEIDEWLGGGKWDLIHFNWGLHDLKYMGPAGQNLADPKAKDSHQQVPPKEYGKNLDQLVTRLKKTGAKLIWRNTTPVPEGAAGRVVGDSAKYNMIAAKVMEKHGVPTHDMFALVKPQQDKIMRPANVHFTPEGSEALGRDVARVITAALGN
jgi:acyl-CoA thioesterase-1